ncbi:SgcJ/EcaC family oxidoreductase [Streptomyces sp. SID10853]|uniref:SgcJ/EcaC family oxidoreductase n=1 Tax=Streptomyces sp. SID10853 TaxID=2706028 RepID=UPI0013BEE22A|nr:SgcJ/EcaC family oxidoreductase [Streptomyces sp. SID10853]NDZ78946.1 SgcJ/EcaC family oxidoreductase [Streptomyces sp. SID10853]
MEPTVEALSAVPARMIEGWNRGDAAAFVADFAQDAELVDFDGTVHKGRDTVIASQQPVFDTVLKGSRLVRSEVSFARVVGPGWGVVHHRFGMVMAGEKEPLPSRYFLQLFALVWQNDRWEVATLLNSRLVSLDAAMALDGQAAG